MDVEIRTGEALIKGYVNAVGRDSREIHTAKGAYVEQVRSGVWAKAIESRTEVLALLNHDKNMVLGSTKSNLSLKEDNIGLYAELRTTDTGVIQKAQDNELSGWSFGFIAEKVSWGKTDDEIDRRYLDEIELLEVSLVDKTRTPAYFGTSIEKRDNKMEYIETRFIDDGVQVSVEKVAPEENIDVMLKLLELENEI